ncbi:saccharopine dehydrogenase [Legionella beliardensis]|uniref:Saccharopine dehydrogenase n=1 Tax=Legionella beliardensis TaxID=91822 RepID=A0A378JP22_9GAMM|nr:saccharopine dehydrogenase NADP-binding domain-containing protein [Legionella beliardensis]STX55635.1 saccharopine dehydrogenase [Legionella beliardensis]
MEWIIYGANGYSGALIAREARARGMHPILAGRNEALVKKLADELELSYRIFGLNDIEEITQHLSNITLLLNCAGPFSKTSKSLIQACLNNHTHYLDITGEIDIFEYAQTCDNKAKEANILLCPGVGFDVIPTDCIAHMLKQVLPDAIQLTLGFDSKSHLSPGTTKTAIEGLAKGGRIRRNGQLIDVPLAYKTRSINFGNGEKLAMTIPWGDISTAYYSTRIPNIEVYIPASKRQIFIIKSINFIRWFFRFNFVQNWLKKKAAYRNGPDAEQRKQSTWVWGEVKNASGICKSARLKTANGYALTVTGSLMTVEFILNNNVKSGYTTPSLLLGDDAVTKLPGSSKIQLD